MLETRLASRVCIYNLPTYIQLYTHIMTPAVGACPFLTHVDAHTSTCDLPEPLLDCSAFHTTINWCFLCHCVAVDLVTLHGQVIQTRC